jgi:hypothetical protein
MIVKLSFLRDREIPFDNLSSTSPRSKPSCYSMSLTRNIISSILYISASLKPKKRYGFRVMAELTASCRGHRRADVTTQVLQAG